MARYRIEGRVNHLYIGASSASNVDIAANVKFMRWRRQHRITPQTAANSKIPIGWFQPHSWIEGELGVISEAKDAFYDQATAYIDDDGDNTVIPYVVLVVDAHDGTDITFTFDNFIISYVEKMVEDYDTSIFVYHFLAYKVTRS